jgi:hypothetical protein
MVTGSRAGRGRVGDRETREMAGPGFRSKLCFARLKAGGEFRWLGFETEVLKTKVAHSYWLKPCHVRSQTPRFAVPISARRHSGTGESIKVHFYIIREISQTGGALLFFFFFSTPLIQFYDSKIWKKFPKK